jgi:hypothetical protein
MYLVFVVLSAGGMFKVARVIPDELLKDARKVESGYEPPKAPKEVKATDETLKLVASLIQQLPGMIKAPIVHVETPKPPDVKVTSPVYVTSPKVEVPQPPAIQMPEGKAPVVNVEPPVVHLSVSRPKAWKFTVHRNDFGQITTIDAEAK